MANLTATSNIKYIERRLSAYDMKRGGLALAAQVIFKGGMVGIDATTGLIRKGGGVIATFRGGMLGRAKRTFNPAVVTDQVEWDQGIFRYTNVGGITIADRGKICFADDDQSVSLTATNVTAGFIEDVDTTGVWVGIGPDTRVA